MLCLARLQLRELVLRSKLDCFQASRRSNVYFFKYDLRRAWIPSTREVAVLPKCVNWSTHGAVSGAASGAGQRRFYALAANLRHPTTA